MSDDQTLISVVMPNRNGEPWLAEAIESVLTQSHEALELLVVDDHSSDQSQAVIRRYMADDPRVRLLAQNEAVGVSRARNLAMEAARGDYIALLDSDDRMRAGMLERRLGLFRAARARRHDLQLICGDAMQIDEKGRPLTRYMPVELWDRVIEDQTVLWPVPSTWFLARSCPARFHPKWRSGEAGPFLHQVRACGSMVYCGELLSDYRLRVSSLTNETARDMLKGMRATDATLAARRSWTDPILPDQMPEPPLSEIIAWKYGRVAKCAAANRRPLLAASALALASLAAPRVTLGKIVTELHRQAARARRPHARETAAR